MECNRVSMPLIGSGVLAFAGGSSSLHRHWPEPEKMLVTVNHYDTPDGSWYTNPTLSARVLSEWKPYKAQGFIAPWP
jgi:hypothetical protein